MRSLPLPLHLKLKRSPKYYTRKRRPQSPFHYNFPPNRAVSPPDRPHFGGEDAQARGREEHGESLGLPRRSGCSRSLVAASALLSSSVASSRMRRDGRSRGGRRRAVAAFYSAFPFFFSLHLFKKKLKRFFFCCNVFLMWLRCNGFCDAEQAGRASGSGTSHSRWEGTSGTVTWAPHAVEPPCQLHGSSVDKEDLAFIFCFVFLLGIASSQNVSFKFCYFFFMCSQFKLTRSRIFPTFFCYAKIFFVLFRSDVFIHDTLRFFDRVRLILPVYGVDWTSFCLLGLFKSFGSKQV